MTTEAVTADRSQWCEPRLSTVAPDHERCDGTLRGATGYHWWCACTCHALPVLEPEAGTDAHRAWEVWKAARDGTVTP